MKTVIFAGGKGTRLQPYTTVFPKPLMPVGNKPILEIVIEQLTSQGFNDITIAVGHQSELIKAFFGDGSKFNVKIRYSLEDKPLGTVGPLLLMKDELNETFLVMNGDELSKIDYNDLVKYHKKNRNIATVGITKRNVYIDFGVMELDEQNCIKKWIEKPTMDYLVSMGINVFEPEVLSYIPPNRRFDIPELISALMKDQKSVTGYIYEDYWLDIGRTEDYEKANRDIHKLLGDK